MKTTLLKNVLITATLLFSFSAFAQFDFNFNTDGDLEGFTVNGPGASGSVAGGILSATGTGANIQLRRNDTDIGDPTTLTSVILDIKNNTNADRVLIQMGSATVFTQVLSTADATEQSYQIDITDAAWVGVFQFRLRFIIDGGGTLDGNTIEVNRIQIVDPATLSLEENTLSSINLYPNPVKNTLNIESQETISNVEVYDLLGKRVISNNSATSSLDVSTLSNGVYIIKLTSSNGVATKRFIKE